MRPLPIELPSPPSSATGRTSPVEGSEIAVRALILTVVVLFIAYLELTLARGESDRPARGVVVRTVDPNSAPWYELAILPRIGPTLARAIVDFRDGRVADANHTGEHVFRRTSDLDAIRGVGPVTLQRIGPYLRFPSDNQDPFPPN